ncbi:hypothetical protein BJV77DRAFT_961965 [Russula vinacea]|nr:hypothetical protein BJV77DRAFT_961965 [Russula vinacea]
MTLALSGVFGTRGGPGTLINCYHSSFCGSYNNTRIVHHSTRQTNINPHLKTCQDFTSDSAPLWTQGILFLSTNSSLSKQPKSGRKLSATAEICALWFQSVTMDSEIGASFRLPLRQPLFMPDTAREVGPVVVRFPLRPCACHAYGMHGLLTQSPWPNSFNVRPLGNRNDEAWGPWQYQRVNGIIYEMVLVPKAKVDLLE